jgi:hypothetical protein
MAKLTQDEREVITRFNPVMRYTMRRAALQALLLCLPRPAFWNGRTYTVKSKHIGAGVYEVTGDFSGGAS